MFIGEHRALMVRNYQLYLTMRNYIDQPRSDFIPPFIAYIYGKTGTDKSKFTWDWIDRNKLRDLTWRSPTGNQGKFFPKYDNHPVVIFEEVRNFAGGVSGFLEITDGRESVQELKISQTTVILRARVIIMTSDRPLQQVKFKTDDTGRYDYPNDEEVQQMVRRICHRPRWRPGDPPEGRWVNFPLGGIYQFGGRLGNPHIPNLTNVNRRALGLPLLSQREEMELFPHRAVERMDQAMDEIRARRDRIAQLNREAEEALGGNLLDDDEGEPEPQGEAT
jgi:hypothetical protein